MLEKQIELLNADCLKALKSMPDNCIDAIVTDPPYGLAFMGKKWDYDVPSVELWAECLRVLKPGGHLLAFAGTRTQHRMAVRIEDAGFEIRDMIAWVYGSGFPKSHDVSKAIDKLAGRIGYATESIKDILRKAHQGSGRTLTQLNEVCGFEASGYLRDSSTWASVLPPQDKWHVIRDALDLPTELDSLFAEAEREVIGYQKRGNSVNTDFMSGGNDITAPATDAAKQWEGWGTALKPSLEPVTVARKPLIGTVADNVLAHGTGGINIDGCRVEGGERADQYRPENFNLPSGSFNAGITVQGRWPANLIHDGSDEVVAMFPNTTPSKASMRGEKTSAGTHSGWARESHKGFDSVRGHNDNGGSASRFFYCAKASKRDRDEGLDGFEVKRTAAMAGNLVDGQRLSGDGTKISTPTRANIHPTVKPTDLMRYLCRLVTPPNGVVLDPFMGSGSTGKAAVLEGFRFIGIEREAAYFEIASARINDAIPIPEWLK
jgi:DNA modification methylase